MSINMFVYMYTCICVKVVYANGMHYVFILLWKLKIII